MDLNPSSSSITLEPGIFSCIYVIYLDSQFEAQTHQRNLMILWKFHHLHFIRTNRFVFFNFLLFFNLPRQGIASEKIR